LTAAPSAGQALGASINYTGNEFVQATKTTKYGSYVNVSTTNSVTVTGLASYAFVNTTPYTNGVWTLSDSSSDTIVDFVPSLSVSANGSWDRPMKSFGDTSALKVGPELDFRFEPKHAEDFFMIYAGIAPFYQTDFYGKSSAEGATLSLTPSYFPLLLNGAGGEVRYYTGG
jgi:hypothetical protein